MYFPTEILFEISLYSPKIYHSLVTKCRRLHEYSSSKIEILEAAFTRVTIKYMDITGEYFRTTRKDILRPSDTVIKYTYRVCGRKHRRLAPAVVSVDCLKYHYAGYKHRDGGPAVVFREGAEFWYNRGNPVE